MILNSQNKSFAKRSNNLLQNVTNNTAAVKTVRTVFHVGCTHTFKNRHLNGDCLFGYEHNRAKTECTEEMHKKLDGMHATFGAHVDSCTIKMRKISVARKDVPEATDEMKKKID